MNKEQVVDLLNLVAGYYPNWKYANLELTVELWHNILIDYEPDVILENFRAYIKSGKEFAPVVGQLLPQTQGRAIPTSDETKKLLLALDAPKKDLPTKEELLTIFDQMSEMLKVSKG